jgi:sarcosine oxidase subunit alpha
MAKNQQRLPEHDAQLLDRSKRVTFTFDGKPVEAFEGEVVASALHAAGQRIFSRSFKYHRPRGLLCVSGRCPSCLMNVDGAPSIRSCTATVRQGMEVKHQNAWPSLGRDVFSVLDKLDKLLPVGFYYKSLIRPRILWKLASPIIRRIAGLGRISISTGHDEHSEHLHRHTDVAVIGGGPAGMAAALEAAGLGVRVTLIDDQTSLGGHLRSQTRASNAIPEYAGRPGYQVAAQLAKAVEDEPNIEVLFDATAFGLFEGGLVGVHQGKRLVKLRTRETVVATGANEVPLVFRNNDLPGIMLGTGAQRLAILYGVKPGERAVVVTSNDTGYSVAAELMAAGVKIVAVADSRPALPEGLAELQALRDAHVPLLAAHTVKEAHGTKHVTGITLAGTEEGIFAKQERFSCGLVCLSVGFQPATSLLSQAGSRLHFDAELGESVPAELAPSVYTAGEVTGIHHAHAAMLQGRIAGIEAASAVASPSINGAASALDGYRSQLQEVEQSYRQRLQAPSGLVSHYAGKKKVVCYCEDVTEKDLKDAVSEGYDDIELLKRYSTFSMGPCQGKMCSAASVSVCARLTGRSIEDTHTTTSRPPVQPVPLGVLAGPGHMPMRLTSMYHSHLKWGGKMTDLGQWRRPLTYGSAQDEYKAVRERVGVIDVSTLGKLDVRGKDAAQLLDRVYANTHSNLRVGRTRYGVVCSDAGIIMDDGTVSRLADDYFFITTTSGNVEGMEEWYKWWAAGTGMCVHVTNITPAYGAINLAGPKAREVLSKLTDIDLSTEAFGYMRNAKALVGGVPVVMMRIGFVGEMGWEMHFPVEYGEYLWELLLEAGKEYGISPFGLEAQRILRLEKKHIIVTQDTDVISNPLEADMEWIVKFDKEDFIGKPGLLAVQERGYRDRLVGFVMANGDVADDGAAIVAHGKPVGRVTSCRYSGVLGKGFGLAWVPVEMAEPGMQIGVRVKGKVATADIVADPFYDPEGKRLRM